MKYYVDYILTFMFVLPPQRIHKQEKVIFILCSFKMPYTTNK